MNRALAIGIVITALAGSGILSAQNGRRADVQMKAAQQKADVQGDLKGAIEDYKRIVAGAGGNRALAVTALVRMAECYQKLGSDAQSREIYDRVVRDFADQAEAVTVARARFATNPAALNASIVARQVWTGPNVDSYGSVSPDGRFISFTDWVTGDLALHDLVTGRDRNLTGKGGWDASLEYAMGSTVSRDAKQIAYTWTVSVVPPRESRFSEIRLVDVNGGKPRVLITNRGDSNRDIGEMAPKDWSPDSKWLAVSIEKKDGTAITGRLSTTDGMLQVLKTHDDCHPGLDCRTQLLFSPDGRYLAYDWAPDGDSRQRQIHVISVESRSDTALFGHPANDRLLGWSPDGAHLVFASDRGGLSGVWAVTVANGRTQGEPHLLRANLSPNSLGITRAGALYYAVGNSSRDVYVADVDFTAGKVMSAPAIIPKPYIGMNDYPRWSPDGEHLAYLSKKDANTRSSQLDLLLIRSIQSGQVQQLQTQLRYLNFDSFGPLWSRDGGNSLIVTAIDYTGRQGIYRVDATGGEARALITSGPNQPPVIARALSSDGKILYISRKYFDVHQRPEEIMLAYDLTAGREREIARRKDAWGRGFDVSADDRWIARTAFDRDTGVSHLLIYPAEGGAPRELVRVSRPELVIGSFVKFASDGKSILFAKSRRSVNELWRIPIDGGGARKIGLEADWAGQLVQPGNTSASIHPDGHHVAFAMGGNEVEIWAMENIMSALKSGK